MSFADPVRFTEPRPSRVRHVAKLILWIGGPLLALSALLTPFVLQARRAARRTTIL